MGRADGYRWIIFFACLLLAACLWPSLGGGRAYAAWAASEEAASRERADLIALGTVEDVGVRPLLSRVEVSVERVFKGENDNTLQVTTGSGSVRATSVDVPFGEGERYLLYLIEEGDELETSICAGTREVAASSAEIPPGLGEGALPEEASGDSGETALLPRTGGLALAGLPLVLVSVVAGALVWRRR